MAVERADAFKFVGNSVTLVGPELKVGQKAPEFTTVGQGLKPVSLVDSGGKVRVIASVHSLDTGVCSDETKRLSEMAKELPNVEFITISMDLPFAQARWCGANGVENVVTASDFCDRQFGEAYGVMMKEVGLLSRAAFVVDKEGTVQYVEYCPENSIQPNYDAISQVVKGLS